MKSLKRGPDVLTVGEDSDDNDREMSSGGSGDEGSAAINRGDNLKSHTVAFHNEPKPQKKLTKKSEVRIKKLTKKDITHRLKENREKLMMALVKPDITTDKEKERLLRRIATKGVVQLFNAVATRQKSLDEGLNQAKTMKERKEAEARLNERNFDPYQMHLDASKGAKEEDDDDMDTSGVKEEESGDEDGSSDDE